LFDLSQIAVAKTEIKECKVEVDISELGTKAKDPEGDSMNNIVNKLKRLVQANMVQTTGKLRSSSERKKRNF